MACLELRGVSKIYGEQTALQPLDLTVQSGSLTVLVGPSGCGKTTILRLIAGLETQTGGEIWLDGRRIDHLPPRERNVAMVFQNFALYPHMTAGDNIAFPLRIQGIAKTEITKQVQEVAGILGIGGLLERRPDQLSGGERQRVALGRAMVRKPLLFLLDEPLSSLDAKLRDDLRRELLLLHERLGATMIYVTHDQTEALTLADTLMVLEGGRLRQEGTPAELYLRPADMFVADFIGSPPMSFLPARLERRGCVQVVCAAGSECTLPRTSECEMAGEAREIMVGIRPEEVHLCPAGGMNANELVLAGIVTSAQIAGHQVLTAFGAADDSWRVTLLENRKMIPWHRGEQVRAFVSAEDLHFFDPRTGDRIMPPDQILSNNKEA